MKVYKVNKIIDKNMLFLTMNIWYYFYNNKSVYRQISPSTEIKDINGEKI